MHNRRPSVPAWCSRRTTSGTCPWIICRCRPIRRPTSTPSARATALHPDFGTVYDGAPNGIPYITVLGTQTKYPATFTYADESDPGPYADSVDRTHRGRQLQHGRPARDLRRHHELHPVRNVVGLSAVGQLVGGLRRDFQFDLERASPGRMDVGRRRGLAGVSRTGEVRRSAGRRNHPRHPAHRIANTAYLRLAGAPLCIQLDGLASIRPWASAFA